MAYRKLLILGLDALTWSVVKPLADAGHMPVLRGMMERGSWGVLESTVPAMTPAAWTTFATGVEPGVHGVLGFSTFDPHTEKLGLRTVSPLTGPTIYHTLSAAGFKVGVAMQPVTHPPLPLSGWAITGFDSGGTRGRFAHPQELEREILELCPEHEAHYNLKREWEEDDGVDDAVFERIVTRMRASLRRLTNLYAALLKRYPVDVAMLYFQSPDLLFHYGWRWCDLRTAHESPARRAQVEAYFKELDDCCGTLLDAMPSEDRLALVVSDHGQQETESKIAVNNVLAELGFLTVAGPVARLRARLARGRAKPGQQAFDLKRPVDWARTQAYMAFAEHTGYVYVNLEGRQPQGCVTRTGYNRVRDAVIEGLRSFKHPQTGTLLFPRVLNGDEYFVDKEARGLPDILIDPPEGGIFTRKIQRRGTLLMRRKRSFFGWHHPDGLYVFDGPDVKPGAGPRAHLRDMAPTLLAALGQSVPSFMTGRPMQECFSRPLDIRTHSADWTGTADAAPALSEEDAKLVEQRLADLGYID